MGRKNSDLVISLEQFFDKNFDVFLHDDELIADEEWERLITELINVTDSYDMAQEILKPFHRNATGSEALQQETKLVLAEALALLFFKRKANLTQWMTVLDWFRIHREFYAALKEKLEGNHDLTPIEAAVKYIFTQPEQFVFNSERDSFISYINSWKAETNLRQLWLCGENSYFPFDYNAFFFPCLLLPDKIEKLAVLCNLLKAPCLLYEFFAHCWHFYSNEELLLVLLEKAPIANKNDNSMVWNQSFVAPALLHYLVSKRLRVKSTDRLKPEDMEEAQKYFERIGSILCKREDGFFLASNYLRYLTPRKYNNINLANLCMACIGETFAIRSIGCIEEKQLANLFPDAISGIKHKFCETGVLLPKQDDSICLDVISRLQFSKDDEQAKVLLPYLKAALMFEDESLQVYESSPLLCHYDVAAIYMAFGIDRVVSIWEKTWNLFAMGRRRVAYSYFDTMSVALRSNMKFILLIGSALLNLLYVRKEFAVMKSLWDKLWKVAKGNLQTKSEVMEDFYLDYAVILTVWHARYEKAIREQIGDPIINESERCCKDSDKNHYESTVCLIESIAYYPKLAILSVQCLQINSCLETASLTVTQRNRLRKVIKSALQYYDGIVNEGRLYKIGEKCLAGI